MASNTTPTWSVSAVAEPVRRNIQKITLVGSRGWAEQKLAEFKKEGLAAQDATIAIQPAEER